MFCGAKEAGGVYLRAPRCRTGIQQHIIGGVAVGTFLPGGHVLHVHPRDQIPNGLGHIGGHVGIQQQPGLHTRRKEWFGTSVSNSSKGRRPASRSAAISSGKALA